MQSELLQSIIGQLLTGKLSATDFETELLERFQPKNSGDFVIDHDRQQRCGYPEVVYGEGKTAETIEHIFREQGERGNDSFATRISQVKGEHLLSVFPTARYNPVARTFRLDNSWRNLNRSEIQADSQVDGEPDAPSPRKIEGGQGKVAIISAGTSDRPVAQEAYETALWMGAKTVLIQDVGVAGPHRLRAKYPLFQDADAIVVVAGMEGALPSVVGGYVSAPVVAVPTSVGYGAGFGGLAALLGMLNSCASNVTVVNIDAGFKGGYVAGLIANRVAGGKVSV